MAVGNSKIIHTLHTYVATPSTNDDLKRIWQPQQIVQFGNSGTGYQQDAFILRAEPRGMYRTPKGTPGFMSAELDQSASDKAAENVFSNLCDLKKEVIATYRMFEQIDREWTNTKTLTVWGYLTDVSFSTDGGGSLNFEVHVMRRATIDDVNGTMTVLIDCINEEQDENNIFRNPDHMAPSATPVAENWGDLLDA